MYKWIQSVLTIMLLTNLSAQKLEIVKYTFDDNKIGLTTFSNTMRKDSVDAGIDNGKYIFQNYHNKKGVNKWSILNYGLNSNANTGYKASITQMAGVQDYSYGLVVNAENGNNYIMFGISSNGYYIILYSKAGTVYNISNGWVKSSLVKTGYNVNNDFYIEKIGNNYQFFLNDVSLKTQSIVLSKFSANVGLFANSNMKVGLDHLEIKQWANSTTIPGKIAAGYNPINIFPVAAKPEPTISKQNEAYRVEVNLFDSRYGLKDKDGYRLVDPVFKYAYMNHGYFIAGDEATNTMGVYDMMGNMIVLPFMKKIIMSKSQSAIYFSCRSESGLWGLVDNTGKTILPFVYSYIDEVSEGYIYVKNGKGWGLIDLNGLPKIEPGTIDDKDEKEASKYRLPVTVQNGRIIVKAKYSDGGKLGVMDLNGKWVIMPKYFEISKMDSNQHYMASIVKPGDSKRLVWGVIDKIGKEVIPFKYSSLSIHGKNYIVAEGNDPWGDDLLEDLEEDDDEDFLDALDSEEKRKWGLLSPTGAEILPVKLFYIELTSEKDILMIEEKEKSAIAMGKLNKSLFDLRKKTMFSLVAYDEYKYDKVKFNGKPKGDYRILSPYFAEGVINVAKAGKWGFIDKTGKIIIPFQYDHASAFSKGAALIKNNNEWFYINKQGKKINENEANKQVNYKEIPPIRPGVL